MKHSKKILFLIKERIHDSVYGVTSGLFNSAQFVVNFLKGYGVDVKLVSIIDSNSIDREVTKFNPDLVVLEALWATPQKLQELIYLKRHEKRRWIIRIHSKAPFLANDGPATDWIRDYTNLNTSKVFIAPNTLELTKQFQSCFPKGRFIHLPNLYNLGNVESEYSGESKSDVHVGCFGAIRPMKNQYLQAMAAIDFAKRHNLKLHFHINATRTEQKGESSLKNIRGLFKDSNNELVEHSWMHHKDFLKEISKMDIGSQVSFSESFNIVSADFVQMGVPIVVCDDIEWMPKILMVSPTAWKAISLRMSFAYLFRSPLAWLQTKYLEWYLWKSEWVWINKFLSL